MADAFQARMSGSTLRVRSSSPFFATLLLFARIRTTENIATAATDGRDIMVNPDYVTGLANAELDGLLAHEVMHCALNHVTRRLDRDAWLWNVAADIVVNGQLAAAGFSLPGTALRDAQLEKFSTEEVYSLLMQLGDGVKTKFVLPSMDLLEKNGGGDQDNESGPSVDLASYWKGARQQAHMVARMAASSKGRGFDPSSLSPEFALLDAGQLDWHQHLWRFMVSTPTDYSGFDRRFVSEGLYLDAVEGESVDVLICIDTSGSVGAGELGQFRAEVLSILRCYPHIRATVFFADATLHGPFRVTRENSWPDPVGGGGTSFVPFFRWLADHPQHYPPRFSVYLTDGYGDFPETVPAEAVLWVVSPGGLASTEFPFGEVARLVR